MCSMLLCGDAARSRFAISESLSREPNHPVWRETLNLWDWVGLGGVNVAVSRKLSFSLILMAGLCPSTAFAEPNTYRLDPDHMSIAFLVEHVGFAKVLGAFHQAEGEIVFDEVAPSLERLVVTVATGSVDTRHAARDEHLRSDDFFDSETYPEMVFTMSGTEQTGERTGTVTGNLTLKGETHPVTLDVVWNKAGAYPFGDRHYAVGISARGSIERSTWGMTYGVADGLVGDTIELIIEAEFIRQE